jgi:hypothetical protein
MVLIGTMRKSSYCIPSPRGRKPRKACNSWVAVFIASCGLWFDVAQGNPWEDLDLDRPVRDVRLPLIAEASGSAAGLITAREIRLEAQAIGPFRVRNLASPEIQDLSVQLPEKAEAGNNTWVDGLAQFLVIGQQPAPPVIHSLKIKSASSHDILHARRATFDAPTGRLEMQDATVLNANHAPRQFHRIWLLLKGPQAGFLVWRTEGGKEAATRHLLDRAAMPDDT